MFQGTVQVHPLKVPGRVHPGHGDVVPDVQAELLLQQVELVFQVLLLEAVPVALSQLVRRERDQVEAVVALGGQGRVGVAGATRPA